MTRAVLLSALAFAPLLSQAQIFQFAHDQMVEYTKENPFDRFPDGRPKVPDELIKKLQDVSAEDVWSVLESHKYFNQYAGGWRILHPEKHLVGRAVTAQFMPSRDDVQAVAEAKAAGSGSKRSPNQRVIDTLQERDVIVVDLYGKEEDGTYVGSNLAAAIQAFTHTGMVVDGAIRDLEGIQSLEMPSYIRGAHPTPLRNSMLTGVNVPIRIENATVMPGDIVLGDGEGLYFIPPQFVKEIIEKAEEVRVRDDWTQMMLKTGKYKSSDLYPKPRDPELQKAFDDYKQQHSGH